MIDYSCGAQRRWIMRALLCLSLVLAQLLVVSHFHPLDSQDGIAIHDCYTCTVAEHFDHSPLDSANKIAVTARQLFISQDQTALLLVNAVSPYFARAPPHFTTV